MKPFSDNIIFYDSEFSSLNPEKGALLSVGMVKMNGEELYFELEANGETDPWVEKNVLPYLSGEKISVDEALKKMKEFAGSKTPFLLSYVDNYDAVYLKKIIGHDKRNIFHWMSVDIASMFFAMGRNPEDFGNADKNGEFKRLGIDFSKYREHHALDDAKLLREYYMKVFNINV